MKPFRGLWRGCRRRNYYDEEDDISFFGHVLSSSAFAFLSLFFPCSLKWSAVGWRTYPNFEFFYNWSLPPTYRTWRWLLTRTFTATPVIALLAANVEWGKKKSGQSESHPRPETHLDLLESDCGPHFPVSKKVNGRALHSSLAERKTARYFLKKTLLLYEPWLPQTIRISNVNKIGQKRLPNSISRVADDQQITLQAWDDLSSPSPVDFPLTKLGHMQPTREIFSQLRDIIKKHHLLGAWCWPQAGRLDFPSGDYAVILRTQIVDMYSRYLLIIEFL